MSNFKIQKVSDDGTLGTQFDIEDTFTLKVLALGGITNTGNVKGVTEETFAESKGSNVYVNKNIDGTVNYEETEITLDVFFNNQDRYDSYLAFLKYVCGNQLCITDTNRGIKAYIWCLSATEPTDYVYKGQEYLRSTIKFENKNGNFETI